LTAARRAITRATQARQARGVSAFRAFVDSYLSEAHLASIDTGCPVAARGCDMARQTGAVRQASAQRVERLIARVRDTLPGATHAAAAVIVGTLVGSLQLARALGDNTEGRAVLAAARRALIQQHDSAARDAG